MSDYHTDTPPEAWEIKERIFFDTGCNKHAEYEVYVPAADDFLCFDSREEAEAFAQIPVRLAQGKRLAHYARRFRDLTCSFTHEPDGLDHTRFEAEELLRETQSEHWSEGGDCD